MTYTEMAPTDKLGPIGANGTSTPREKKKKGRSRPKLLALVVVVLAVAAFAADKFVLTRHHRPAHAVPGALVRLPETTLNLSDGHLLQVALAVQLQQGVGSAKAGLPAGKVAQMEDDEITVLSSFSEATLLSGAGKDKARLALLEAFRTVVGPGPAGPGVLAVYFTDFVMQ